MNQIASIQKLETRNDARKQLKLQLAEHLAQQPESTQAAHRWMKRLEAAGAGIIVATFIVALYVSITWKSVNPIVIPVSWFVFAASAAPTMIVAGLDAILLQAFPTSLLPGKPSRFVTGSRAVWTGWAYILGGLAAVAFWGYLAYAVATLNMALIASLVSILGTLMGFAIAGGIIVQFINTTTKQIMKSW